QGEARHSCRSAAGARARAAGGHDEALSAYGGKLPGLGDAGADRAGSAGERPSRADQALPPADVAPNAVGEHHAQDPVAAGSCRSVKAVLATLFSRPLQASQWIDLVGLWECPLP